LRRRIGVAFTWRRVVLGAVGAGYLTGAAFLAALATERIRADRERLAVVRAQEQRQRQARERAMRVELEHEAGRTPARAR
jgi:hypothetical protein